MILSVNRKQTDHMAQDKLNGYCNCSTSHEICTLVGPCCVVMCCHTGSFYPYSTGLLHHVTTPVPMQQPWRIQMNKPHFPTKTKHNKTKFIFCAKYKNWYCHGSVQIASFRHSVESLILNKWSLHLQMPSAMQHQATYFCNVLLGQSMFFELQYLMP